MPQIFKQAEYAKLIGVSRAAVLYQIRTGKLKTNGKTGRDCRIILDDAEMPVSGHDTVAKSSVSGVHHIKQTSVPKDIDLIRAEKLEVDTAIQRQKLDTMKLAMLREYDLQLADLYAEHFTPLRAALAGLRVTKAESDRILSAHDSCTAAFLAALRALHKDDEDAV